MDIPTNLPFILAMVMTVNVWLKSPEWGKQNHHDEPVVVVLFRSSKVIINCEDVISFVPSLSSSAQFAPSSFLHFLQVCCSPSPSASSRSAVSQCPASLNGDLSSLTWGGLTSCSPQCYSPFSPSSCHCSKPLDSTAQVRFGHGHGRPWSQSHQTLPARGAELGRGAWGGAMGCYVSQQATLVNLKIAGKWMFILPYPPN